MLRCQGIVTRQIHGIGAFLCARIKIFFKFSLQSLKQMKSASNRGILKDRLQVLHMHVLVVAPLVICFMEQSGTN